MKRNIITTVLTAWLCAAAVQAQEVILVHMKDGTTTRIASGIESASISFFGDAEGNDLPELATADFSDGDTNVPVPLGGDWHVADYSHAGGDYAVAIAWRAAENTPANATYALCVGTEPGLTALNADTIFFEKKSYAALNDEMSTQLATMIPGDGTIYYALIGNNSSYWDGQLTHANLRYDNNNVSYPLQRGYTYYYRIALKVTCEPSNAEQTEQGKETEEYYVYGPEQSFRVPFLARDLGYTPGRIYCTDEAWQTFLARLSDNVNAVFEKQLEYTMFPEWAAEQEIDLFTAEVVSFDDGDVYFLPTVPEEFFTWLCQREIVADDLDRIALHPSSGYSNGAPLYSLEPITDVAESWNVPGNSYLLSAPLEGSTGYSPEVIVNFTDAVPGVRYKLTITFAPETRFTPDADGNYAEEDNVHFLPTKLQIACISNFKLNSTPSSDGLTPWGFYVSGAGTRITNPEDGTRNFYASGTETQSIVLEDLEPLENGCLVLDIRSSTYSSELRRGTANNELRIAEVRLTPVGLVEVEE